MNVGCRGVSKLHTTLSTSRLNKFNGSIAQLGEHLPYKQGVTGSSPVTSTIIFLILGYFNYGLVVQLVRMPPCHGGGRGFESHLSRQIFVLII